MPEGVSISLDEMYRLLLKIDGTVTALAESRLSQGRTLADHEERLRIIEAQEDQTRRIASLEASDASFRSDLEALKVRVYAIPGASIVIAAAAVVLTLIRTF
jgi:hypothetical protein